MFKNTLKINFTSRNCNGWPTINLFIDDDLYEETCLNKENFENYKIKYFNAFNKDPSHLSLLSYDLVRASVPFNFSSVSKTCFERSKKT